MTATQRGIRVAGVLLVLLSLVGEVGDRVWNSRAQEAARQRLLQALPEVQRKRHFNDSEDELLRQLSGVDQEIRWLRSIPSGAEVWQHEQRVGATPMPHPGGDSPLELSTPWRSATVGASVLEVVLSATPLAYAFRLAGLLGVALIGWSVRAGRQRGQAPSAPLAVTDEKRYGDFVRLEQAGQGSMGTVYRARASDPKDRKAYALKVLDAEWGESQEFRQRFEREYQICRQLDSDRVVRVYARGEKDGRLWMVMDFVEGETLAQWLAAGHRDQSEVLQLAVAICEGLAYAHHLGIVHRDLKPDNILITANQAPVIADFGLARSAHYATITQAHTVLGTPAYIAPEQVEGSSSDAQADLYSLGCILYEALAGRPPFVGEAMEVVLAQLTQQPEPLSRHAPVSPTVEALVHRLLAKEKSQRYGSAEELRQALLSANSGASA